MTVTPLRRPAGTRTGGQFATHARAEAATTLAAAPSVSQIDAQVVAARAELADLLVAVGELEAAVKARGEQLTTLVAGPCPDTWATQARRQLSDLQARLGQARTAALRAGEQLADTADLYPWSRTGQPTVHLSTGHSRPVNPTTSGRFGFFLPPADPYGPPPVVAVAVVDHGRWRATGTQLTANQVHRLDPTRTVTFPDGTVLDPREARELVAAAAELDPW